MLIAIDRNTTRRHPDADTSENACIEAPDVAVSRTHSRHRSFLSYSHSKTSSSGKIDPNADPAAGLYDNIQYAGGSKELRSVESVEKEAQEAQEAQEREDVIEAPKTVTIVANSVGEKEGPGYKEAERKKGVLRKSNSHRS